MALFGWMRVKKVIMALALIILIATSIYTIEKDFKFSTKLLPFELRRRSIQGLLALLTHLTFMTLMTLFGFQGGRPPMV